MPTILVADSRPESLGFYNYLLVDAGYTPALCMSANACHALARLIDPALIIIDLRLSSVDCGLRVIGDLADDPQTRHIPLVVCTADVSSARTHAAWLKSRVRAVLEKPFEVASFFETISGILSTSTTPETPSPGVRSVVEPKCPARSGERFPETRRFGTPT